MPYAVLFPGQGSQFVGMGSDLFDEDLEMLGSIADSILGWSLRELCMEGPEDKLTRTEYAQPALFSLSLALWLELSAQLGIQPSGGAGHSLGEYTALAAAGALSYSAALGLVSRRGRAMAEAADSEDAGMAAVLGCDLDTAVSVVAARQEIGGRLQIANINAPGQIVLAGAADDLDWLDEHGKELGVRRSVRLKVAGAFHSSFMESAARELANAFSAIELSQTRFPIWSNVSAKPHGSEIGSALVDQVTMPVRFSDSLLDMRAEGITTFVHVGPGDVTAGLAKRTVDDAEIFIVSTLADIPPVVDALGTM